MKIELDFWRSEAHIEILLDLARIAKLRNKTFFIFLKDYQIGVAKPDGFLTLSTADLQLALLDRKGAAK